MDVKPRFRRNCPECKTSNDVEFKKVLDLQNSGLVVYVHKQGESLEEKKSCVRKNEFYILHNTSHKDLKRPDFINELCQYRTKCFRCKTIIQKVRSLLDEISAIRGNEVLGVCTYCKKANPAGKCRRCQFIINKFRNNNEKQNEDRQTKFKTWLERVREFLESFMEEEKSCRHKIHREGSATELQDLLEELKLPLTMHEPDIDLFTTADSEVMISQSKEMLKELLSKLKYRTEERELSNLHLLPSASNSTCVCKHLRHNKFLAMPPVMDAQKKIDILPLKETDKVEVSEKKSVDKKEDYLSPVKEKVKTAPRVGTKVKKISKEKGKAEKENKPPKEPPKELKQPKEPMPPKKSLSPEEKLMLKMMKQREQQKKQIEKPVKKAKSIVLPKFEDLPPLKFHEVVIEEES